MVDYELNELKREFLVEAEEKVKEMQSTLEGKCDSQALDRLAYLAHQLKGSGGSYGYGRISTDAAEIERAVEQIAGGAAPGSVEATIQQHVLNLRAEIEKSVRELVLA